MTRKLSGDVETALAAIAADGALLDRDALESLVRIVDAVAVDDRHSEDRCGALSRGLEAALGADVSRALAHDADAPAEIAARFFRLRHLAALADALSAPRR